MNKNPMIDFIFSYLLNFILKRINIIKYNLNYKQKYNQWEPKQRKKRK